MWLNTRMRIVSLIASATEIVAALEFADQLVGVSHECDYPLEAVKGRTVVTSPKMDVTRKSPDIHKDVQAIVARGLSVYNIDVEKLKALNPDVIITQDQCEVCAVTYEDVVQATRQCLNTNAKIVTLHPDSLEDIFADIFKVAEALEGWRRGALERGEKLMADLWSKMNHVAAQTKGPVGKPRVVCLEWLSPLMVAGNWMPRLVAMAGGVNGITQEGEHTKVISWDELRALDPDILLLMPCGFKIAQTLENRADLESLPGFAQLQAVRNQKVFVIDGNTYMNRPGPRILESLYILAGVFHPNLFKELIPKDSVIVLER